MIKNKNRMMNPDVNPDVNVKTCAICLETIHETNTCGSCMCQGHCKDSHFHTFCLLKWGWKKRFSNHKITIRDPLPSCMTTLPSNANENTVMTIKTINSFHCPLCRATFDWLPAIHKTCKSVSHDVCQVCQCEDKCFYGMCIQCYMLLYQCGLSSIPFDSDIMDFLQQWGKNFHIYSYHYKKKLISKDEKLIVLTYLFSGIQAHYFNELMDRKKDIITDFMLGITDLHMKHMQHFIALFEHDNEYKKAFYIFTIIHACHQISQIYKSWSSIRPNYVHEEQNKMDSIIETVYQRKNKLLTIINSIALDDITKNIDFQSFSIVPTTPDKLVIRIPSSA